jgi:hypothetical protein
MRMPSWKHVAEAIGLLAACLAWAGPAVTPAWAAKPVYIVEFEPIHAHDARAREFAVKISREVEARLTRVTQQTRTRPKILDVRYLDENDKAPWRRNIFAGVATAGGKYAVHGHAVTHGAVITVTLVITDVTATPHREVDTIAAIARWQDDFAEERWVSRILARLVKTLVTGLAQPETVFFDCFAVKAVQASPDMAWQVPQSLRPLFAPDSARLFKVSGAVTQSECVTGDRPRTKADSYDYVVSGELWLEGPSVMAKPIYVKSPARGRTFTLGTEVDPFTAPAKPFDAFCRSLADFLNREWGQVVR